MQHSNSPDHPLSGFPPEVKNCLVSYDILKGKARKIFGVDAALVRSLKALPVDQRLNAFKLCECILMNEPEASHESHKVFCAVQEWVINSNDTSRRVSTKDKDVFFDSLRRIYKAKLFNEVTFNAALANYNFDLYYATWHLEYCKLLTMKNLMGIFNSASPTSIASIIGGCTLNPLLLRQEVLDALFNIRDTRSITCIAQSRKHISCCHGVTEQAKIILYDHLLNTRYLQDIEIILRFLIPPNTVMGDEFSEISTLIINHLFSKREYAPILSVLSHWITNPRYKHSSLNTQNEFQTLCKSEMKKINLYEEKVNLIAQGTQVQDSFFSRMPKDVVKYIATLSSEVDQPVENDRDIVNKTFNKSGKNRRKHK
tara:strand:- start:793 stop:1902 length:1110 start_codon:yes stop_codon:yes gene_type:complete